MKKTERHGSTGNDNDLTLFTEETDNRRQPNSPQPEGKENYRFVKHVGWVPVEWEVKEISEWGKVITGSTPATSNAAFFDGEYPFVTPADLGNFKVVKNASRTLTQLGMEQVRTIPEESILFTCIGLIGKTGIAGTKLATNQQINSIVLGMDGSSEFLYYLLTYKSQWIGSLAATQVVPIINKSDFQRIKLVFPPLPEQQKIARILGAWDRALERLEKLIRAKREYRKGLAQRLLSGEVRFGEFEGEEWKRVRLGDVTRELRERNNGRYDEHLLYGVSKFEGMIPNQERVQTEDISRYKIVQPKSYAYNPMRLNIGSIARLETDYPVLVSPDYVVFECREGRLDSDYLNHYRRSFAWSNFVERSGDGSVRIRIYYQHLTNMRLLLPSLSEQRRIASVLNEAEKEIAALEREHVLLTEQKRGLMELLLRGEVRVHVEDEEVGDG